MGGSFEPKLLSAYQRIGLSIDSREITGGGVALVGIYTKIIEFLYSNFSGRNASQK